MRASGSLCFRRDTLHIRVEQRTGCEQRGPAHELHDDGTINRHLNRYWYQFANGDIEWFVTDSRTRRNLSADDRRILDEAQEQALLRRLGVAAVEPLGFQVPAAFAWSKPGKRREYLRARIEQGRAVLYPNQSSGVLRSAAWADGLVEVLENRTLVEGDSVRFLPFSELL